MFPLSKVDPDCRTDSYGCTTKSEKGGETAKIDAPEETFYSGEISHKYIEYTFPATETGKYHFVINDMTNCSSRGRYGQSPLLLRNRKCCGELRFGVQIGLEKDDKVSIYVQ